MRTLPALTLAALIPTSIALAHTLKPMPPGTNTTSPHRPGTARLLTDLTYTRQGTSTQEHTIIPHILTLIDRAQKFLVLDVFLFNDGHNPDTTYPALTRTITDALLTKRRTHPHLPIILITDPINTFYGSYTPPHLQDLKDAGIQVIITNLDPLPDSNPTYSWLYRALLRHLPHSPATLPNPLIPGGPAATPAGYAALFNFKANHRKVALSETEAVISSANPHDASAPNSNLGFHVTGPILADILTSEAAVYTMSGGDPNLFPQLAQDLNPQQDAGTDSLQLVTEAGIRTAALDIATSAQAGETLTLGMFYLSERRIITALKDAAARGVTVQAVLDLNIDAFGRKKTGLPAQPVAAELAAAGVQVRWYATTGEQYHPKFLARQGADTLDILAGSGNFTRRNICNYNLETSLRVRTTPWSNLARDFTSYWERIWTNQPQQGQTATYTRPYEPAPTSRKTLTQQLIYRLQEATGISTF